MPTHVAARMEQLATPGSIVITAETLAPIEPLVDVRPLGRVTVKGLAEGVDAYEVLGLRSACLEHATSRPADRLA
jgi:class 3 adenylate cyclase